ncbi:MAG: DUF1553 domain-containing protein [Candidatus Hydrogenedentes bacterium]|nr:DUF1553 domain-containing protein [Candidatus Hydrogenedentota bacterium]
MSCLPDPVEYPAMHPCRLLIAVGLLALGILAMGEARAAAADAVLLPSSLALHEQGQEHQLLLGSATNGQWLGNLESGVAWSSADAAIATVDEQGRVTAHANGATTIVAAQGDRQWSAAVTVSGAEAPPRRNFVNDIQPLLYKTGCSTGACHGAASGKNGFRLSLRGYDHESDYKILTRQAKGRRVSTALPAESLLLLKPTNTVPHEGGERFSKDSRDFQILLEWIQQGARPQAEEERKIERIEVLPARLLLQPEMTQPLVVQAHYSDGAVADVTRWVKFATTADTVATVDDNGQVSVLAPGTAALTAWYASKVASAELTVPRPKTVDPAIYARAENYNYIDERILSKLKGLNIAPAAICDDATFVRRAYIDTLGMLPTPEEAQAFMNGTEPAKRSALIDALLARPEFVDYWTSAWSDMLLLSSANLPDARELNAFYRHIRTAVEENRSWDAFVRGIVTASGNTQDNGAANYFLMHREIADLTETTSQAFLGMSLTCARCHNHPLEKWTQDDYYGFANLFARVVIKSGKQGGNDVIPATFGDVLHPLYARPLAPKPLDGGAIDAQAPQDRRGILADWLTAPENPYFTRAVVNRVWKNFMGRGLVEPVDDLRLTNPAANEPLFQALCEDLVEQRYDLKALMRRIMQSAAYQRASEPADPEMPDLINYSQYIVRRMKAEVLLDTYAQVTGVPTPFDGYPAGYRALQLRDVKVASYFLDAFGRPERRQTCACERTEDATITQTLHLANGNTLNEKLQSEASLLAAMVKEQTSDGDAVDRLFWRAFARPPQAEEKSQTVAMLAALEPAQEDYALQRRQALEDAAWALLTSKEFMFNH